MEPNPTDTPTPATEGSLSEQVGTPDLLPSAPEAHVDTGLMIVIATMVTTVIQGLKKSGLLNRVPSRWIPVVSLTLAVAGTVATSVVNGHSLPMSVVEGLLAGLSATGLYEMGKPAKAEAEAA